MPIEVMLIIVVPVALLNIILFFKIWDMTNNTKKIIVFLETQRPDLQWNNYQKEYVWRDQD